MSYLLYSVGLTDDWLSLRLPIEGHWLTRGAPMLELNCLMGAFSEGSRPVLEVQGEKALVMKCQGA